MTFREPKTWRGNVDSTDLNREVRDQFRALRSAVSALESGGGGSATGILPLGFLIGWAGSTIPTGWLVCDGQKVSKGSYPDLYDSLSTTYGADTTLTFSLPNLSVDFLRGANSTGDGTVGARGGTGGYSTNSLTVTLAATTVVVNVSTNLDGGSHSHTYNSQHAHNYNHGSNVWSYGIDHGHNNNDHSHGGATTSSGGGNSGTGNLGTCTSHAHNMSNSNSITHNTATHSHSGDIGNVNVTTTTIGQSSATTGGTQGAHSHSGNHSHDIGHSHVISSLLPEYDDVNWLINWKTDTPENWFIAGSAHLGTSMIGA